MAESAPTAALVRGPLIGGGEPATAASIPD
jgi:hypothetical protein